MAVHNRMHIASLVAVFLALGIGILIGIMLGSPSEQLRGSLVEGIEREMYALRNERRELATAVSRYEQQRDAWAQLVETVADAFLTEVLTDREVRLMPWDDDDGMGKALEGMTAVLSRWGVTAHTVSNALPQGPPTNLRPTDDAGTDSDVPLLVVALSPKEGNGPNEAVSSGSGEGAARAPEFSSPASVTVIWPDPVDDVNVFSSRNEGSVATPNFCTGDVVLCITDIHRWSGKIALLAALTEGFEETAQTIKRVTAVLDGADAGERP